MERLPVGHEQMYDNEAGLRFRKGSQTSRPIGAALSFQPPQIKEPSGNLRGVRASRVTGRSAIKGIRFHRRRDRQHLLHSCDECNRWMTLEQQLPDAPEARLSSGRRDSGVRFPYEHSQFFPLCRAPR